MQALFAWRAKQGRAVYPDANRTLRISYGKVEALHPRDGVTYSPVTTVAGIVEKNTNAYPFDAPKPLLAAIDARLEKMGGGQVSLVGHTDVRGSHAYNQALGLRRASAVFEALRSQLSPAVQQRLRVRNEESAATRAASRQQEARR
ncbi:hypothetical protein G6F35_017143 [Rhizopus arrhizus]|nr:hypothetical protein G6F35_017143 [Rhizopus arrhizus]